jgi:predicted DNA-binding ribbon-helix-helix protein
MKSGAVEGFTSTLDTFSIRIGGRWTTIRLEPELMNALREIADAIDISIHELCTEIAVDCFDGSFTSTLRVFILEYFRGLVPDRLTGHGAAHALPRGLSLFPRRDWMRRSSIAEGAREAEPQLVSFYQWWRQSRPAGNRLPIQIDPRVVRELGLGGLVHIVEAQAADPMNFRYRLWGRRVRMTGGKSLSGHLLSALPGPEYRNAAAEDYFSVATSGCPRLQLIDASVHGSRRVYQRLILPFSGSDGKPDRLLVAVGYQPASLVG